jgi:hypothetical protein
MFSKKCKQHFEDVKMTRWQHFCFAWWFLIQLKKAEIALFIHSFAPRYCQTYASDKIKELAKKLEEH